MSQDPFQALYSGIGGAPLLHLTTIESIYPTVCNICMDVKPLLFLFSLFLAGGSSTIASLLPAKTLAIGGDTRPDQSGVPALFDFSTWQGATPRTPFFRRYGKGLSRVPYRNYVFFWNLFGFFIMAEGDAENPITIIRCNLWSIYWVSGRVCLFGVPHIGRRIHLGLLFPCLICMLKDSVPDGLLKRSNFV